MFSKLTGSVVLFVFCVVSVGFEVPNIQSTHTQCLFEVFSNWAGLFPNNDCIRLHRIVWVGGFRRRWHASVEVPLGSIVLHSRLEWNCEMWRQNKNPAWHCRMCRALLSGTGQCFTDMNVMHFRVRIRIVRGIYKIEIKSPRRHVIYCQDFFFSLHSPHTAIMLCSTPLCFRHCWLCRIWSSILSESLLLKSVLTPTAVDIGAICQLDFSWYGDDGCWLSNAGVNDDDDDETLQKSEEKKRGKEHDIIPNWGNNNSVCGMRITSLSRVLYTSVVLLLNGWG